MRIFGTASPKRKNWPSQCRLDRRGLLGAASCLKMVVAIWRAARSNLRRSGGSRRGDPSHQDGLRFRRRFGQRQRIHTADRSVFPYSCVLHLKYRPCLAERSQRNKTGLRDVSGSPCSGISQHEEGCLGLLKPRRRTDNLLLCTSYNFPWLQVPVMRR